MGQRQVPWHILGGMESEEWMVGMVSISPILLQVLLGGFVLTREKDH